MNYTDYDILELNLKLLNYEEQNPDTTCKLSPSSFAKSNSSLMCGIIHFLLLSYDYKFNETLRLCYPVVTLNDLKLFKDSVYPLLSSILPNNITPGRSVWDLAKGERLLNFLRNFSDFVVKSQLPNHQDNTLDYIPDLIGTGINKENDIWLKMKKNMLLTHISNAREIIWTKSKEIVKIQNKWKTYASNISDEIEKLEQEQTLLNNKIKTLLKAGSTRYNEISSIDRAPKIENHKEFISIWDKLHHKFNNDEEFKNNINYINDNQDWYDMITPETLNKPSERMCVLHDEANSLLLNWTKTNENKEIINTSEHNKNTSDKNKIINDLLSCLLEKWGENWNNLTRLHNSLNSH